ncbi:MAG: KGG domain-containing protein [Vulcanimicrobiaceae bacterium]
MSSGNHGGKSRFSSQSHGYEGLIASLPEGTMEKNGVPPRGGDMSVREAGKKGGDTVRDRYGSEFYEEIGRKGGQATRDRHGSEFYESIGQKGGRVVKEKYGSGFYEEIGHKGGQKVKKLIAEAKGHRADENGRAS